MELTTLYKRNAKGNIIRWQIHELSNGAISIAHGIFGHKPHTEIIAPTLKKVNEVQSRIAAKRKEGYKAVEDLWDNSPKSIGNTGGDYDQNLYEYLNTYLPKYNTTAEGFVLPMLAKTLEDNKPFEKHGTMLGQWKINGLRCLIGAEKIVGDLFNNYRLTYTSREGTKWNLSWMDEIIVSQISNNLLEMMLEEDVHLDGELYLPGYSVNDINSFVKNNTLPQHYLLQYWCYDLAIDDTPANERSITLCTNCLSRVADDITAREAHLNNKRQFIILPTFVISNITFAREYRDKFIDLGFEGLILRNPVMEYAFGKRNSSMFKYKKKLDGNFRIIDIQEDKRGLPVYTLRNDINDETFECTINLPQDKQKLQLQIKDQLIGKLGLVEYRERSGVKQVPFHAKLIKIYI